MAIEFVCPTCNGTLRVGDETAGRVVRCGECRTTLRVPGRASEPEPPPAPPDPFENPPPASNPARDSAEDRDAEPPLAAAEPVERPRARDRSWSDDDDDDRPRRPRDDGRRRPRRRRPPPPPGRGVLFWLALIGGLCLFLTVGCCGGLYLLVPGPEWRKHESTKGGFKVDLPAPPRNDMEKLAGGPPDPTTPMEGTILFSRFEEFAVVYTDIPPNERGWATDKQRLDEAVKALKADGEVQSVVAERDTTVAGFPAREIEFFATGGGWCKARIIIADTRVYVVIAGGRFARPGNENVRRFLDSFEITDRKLKNAGAGRPLD